MSDKIDATVQSLALGALLHDIGKFMQRAHGSEAELAREYPTSVEAEGTYCPVFDGRYSHRHVLWTDAFFDWLVETVGAPDGIDLRLAQKIGASHHRPEAAGEHEALATVVCEADRLSAGMDRRTPEEGDPKRRNFRRQPLLSPLAAIDIGRGPPGAHVHRLGRLVPGTDHLYPSADADTVARELPDRYAELWPAFKKEVQALVARSEPRLFLSTVQGLLETYTWAIPSSTVDTPDISLYDHCHTTAAIACALWTYHSAHGPPGARAVRDRDVPAYRLVAGDLSGIQRSLFTMATQGARGVAKVLRARSFLLSAVVDAAALLVLDAFHLPDVCRVQSAGGRFMVLAPAVTDFDDRLARVQRQLDGWLHDRYLGTLALNLAATAPFEGRRFVGERFLGVMDELGSAVDNAKHRPLASAPTGPIPITYPHGACSVCEMRPARSEGDRTCIVCGQEQHTGQRLPRSTVFMVGPADRLGQEGSVPLPGGLALALTTSCPDRMPHVWKAARLSDGGPAGLPRTWLARYVPTWSQDEWNSPVYRDGERRGDSGEDLPRKGGIKTFHQLACVAKEPAPGGSLRGRALLAVLKADLDHLGLVFSRGIPRDRQSLSRYAGLSRLIEFFFSAHLPRVIERAFPHTYTVFAGGDDLLLIGPWRQTLDLATALNREFTRYVGENPNLTISAAHRFMSPNESLARAAAEAEEDLDASKGAGRNRISVAGRVFGWDLVPKTRDTADILVRWVDGNVITRGFVQRLLLYARMRQGAESNPAHAAWRAHLAYDIGRNFKGRREDQARILELIGLEPDLQARGTTIDILPAAVELALHRLRT